MTRNESPEQRPKHYLRYVVLFVFFANVFISHVILPTLNDGQGFLFFTTWRIFSGKASESISDLTWDDGQTYFFRDQRVSNLASKLNIHTLFFLLQSGSFERIKAEYAPVIKEHCECDNLEIRKLSGSVYEHVILKKTLATTEVVSL